MNGKAADKDGITRRNDKKDEVTGRWIGYERYAVWPLRVVLCLKIGDRL